MAGQLDPQTMLMLQLLQGGGGSQYTAAPQGGMGPGQVAQSPGANLGLAAENSLQKMLQMAALRKMLQQRQQQPQQPMSPPATPNPGGMGAPSSYSTSDMAAG